MRLKCGTMGGRKLFLAYASYSACRGTAWEEEENGLVMKQLFTEAEGDAGWEEGRGDASEWYAPCCTCRRARSGQGGPNESQSRTCRSASSSCSACKHHSTSDTSWMKMWTENKKHKKKSVTQKQTGKQKNQNDWLFVVFMSHLFPFTSNTRNRCLLIKLTKQRLITYLNSGEWKVDTKRSCERSGAENQATWKKGCDGSLSQLHRTCWDPIQATQTSS